MLDTLYFNGDHMMGNHDDNARLRYDFRVGDGATEIWFSDRHAYTVVKRTPKTMLLRRDKVFRTDNNQMSDAQRYAYEPDPEGSLLLARLTKQGWRTGGRALVPGRNEYHDYTF